MATFGKNGDPADHSKVTLSIDITVKSIETGIV